MQTSEHAHHMHVISTVITFKAVTPVLVVLLLLEPIGLEQGVGGVLEAGDGVGSRRGGLQTPRTKQQQTHPKSRGIQGN